MVIMPKLQQAAADTRPDAEATAHKTALTKNEGEGRRRERD